MPKTVGYHNSYRGEQNEKSERCRERLTGEELVRGSLLFWVVSKLKLPTRRG
mgnify:CR=1 FL=1